MKIKVGLVLLMVVISGCYRPNWNRANTTYAQLKADSDWCKTQTQIGAPRSEMIEQYERCMQGKGYELKGKDSSGGGEPTVKVEQQKEGLPIAIEKRVKVYVVVWGSTTPSTIIPLYNYFHKKDCKHLWNVSVKDMTAGEAIANGKSMCPDCFR